MQCDYHDAGACRSCALMNTPYADQLADKDARVRAVLAPVVPAGAWEPAFPSVESGFRNKAKLVAGGRRGDVALGILADDGTVTDLRDCGLYEPGLAEAVHVLPDVVSGLGLTPYDVATRNGELKHVIVTHSPDGELMLRFVLRSEGQLGRLRDGLAAVVDALPGTRVVSANLQPEHKAVLEGADEVVLTDAVTLPMRVGPVTLHLRPRSFFQTNTAVAEALYDQATEWVTASGGDSGPGTLWDLYCGVGGFALHAMTAVPAPTEVLGIEVSDEAVESARQSAAELAERTALPPNDFRVGDATAEAGTDGQRVGPDTLVVNPPRRGIGSDLATWVERSAVRTLVYSSCNATTLARDLALMPSLRPRQARLFDMFPQTHHHEVLVVLERS